MTRSIPAVLLLLSLTLAADATAGRRRAVRSPAPQCSYSLVASWGGSLAAAGVENATISVMATPSTCTSWNAYSLTSWVTVERSGSVVLVDVAPNPTSSARTATLLIAGVKYELVQEAAAVISPPVAGNLLQNAGFDRDLSFWGWQERFPNGVGSAAWASLDAANNPNSGSIRLRNDQRGGNGPAYQQLQCVAVDAGEVYDFGGKFFATSTAGGEAVFSIVQYADEGCGTATISRTTQTPRARTPGTWQSESYTMRMGGSTKSALVVIGGFAAIGATYEVYLDDVFLKKR